MSACRQRQRELSMLVDGEIEGAAKDDLLSHLEVCPRCRDELEKLVELTSVAFDSLRAVRYSSSRIRVSTSMRVRAIQADFGAMPNARALTVLLGIAATLMVAAALVFYSTPMARNNRQVVYMAPRVPADDEADQRRHDGTRPAAARESVRRVERPDALTHTVANADRTSDVHDHAHEADEHEIPLDEDISNAEADAMPAPPDSRFVAYLDVADGPVQRAPRDGRLVRAPAGAGILAGDKLKTAFSRALVRFETGSILALNRFTTVVIARGESPPAIDIVRGEVSIETSRRDIGFEVETPHGSAVDLGTTFAVSVKPLTGSNFLVAEGKIEASTDLGTASVNANWEVDLHSRVAAPSATRYVADVQARLAWTATIPGYNENRAVDIDLKDGLVAFWRFNERRGSIAYDSSGNKFAGRIVGPTWTEGWIGSALEFDGEDDGILVPTGRGVLIERGVSVAFWAWSPVPVRSVGRRLISIGLAKNRGCHSITSGHKLDWHFFDTDGDLDRTCITPGGTPLLEQRWYHLAVTYSDDNDRVRTYVNGTLDRERSTQGKLPPTGGPIVIGAQPYSKSTKGNGWLGKFDEMRVYNRELTPEEVARLADVTRR